MPIVHVAARVGTAFHAQHGGLRAEAFQALVHDRAASHRQLEQPRAALVGVAAYVHARVERPRAHGCHAPERMKRKHPPAGTRRIWAGDGRQHARAARGRAAGPARSGERHAARGGARAGRQHGRAARGARAARGDLREHEHAEQRCEQQRGRIRRSAALHVSLSRRPAGLADGLASFASRGLPRDSPQLLGSPAPGNGSGIRRAQAYRSSPADRCKSACQRPRWLARAGPLDCECGERANA